LQNEKKLFFQCIGKNFIHEIAKWMYYTDALNVETKLGEESKAKLAFAKALFHKFSAKENKHGIVSII